MGSELHAFIDAHRERIIDVCALRAEPGLSDRDEHRSWTDGMISEMGAALEEPTGDFGLSRGVTEMARHHGRARRASGASIDTLVRDFAAFCDAVCTVADEEAMAMAPTDVQAMNMFIEGGIATALEPYATSGTSMPGQLWLILGIGNAVAVARVALDALQSGRVAVHGATGALLDRSISRIEQLVAEAVDGRPSGSSTSAAGESD